MPSLSLGISPLDVSEDFARAGAIQAVDDALERTDLAIYGHVPDEYDPQEGFIAKNPLASLVWICRHMNRTRLVKIIQQIYDNPRDFIPGQDCDRENTAEPGRAESAVPELAGSAAQETLSPGVKRKRKSKERTTRETEKALVEKMNLALVHTIANSEDWEAVKEPEVLTVEEQRYRTYAKALPGVGVNVAAQMISKAAAVGSMEAFRDWQYILKVWKRQHSGGRKLFHRVAVARTALAARAFNRQSETLPSSPAAQLVLSQRLDRDLVDDRGLTMRQRESFKYACADAQKSRVDSIADEMRQRWKLDALYEHFCELEKEIRRLDHGTGARGRRYDGIAKDHLFKVAYESDEGVAPTKEQNPELWSDFGQLLDWGKRWNIIKMLTGSVGIFGLLPKNMIANAWIEKSLTQTRVRQWIDMVLECNEDVPLMAARIEPLFLACMEESEPPSEFLFLEQLDEYRTERPLSLFDRPSDSQHQSTHISFTQIPGVVVPDTQIGRILEEEE